MTDWLSEWYRVIKALHIISVIAWMAGMLYLPRLFVYHADAPVGSAQSELFKIMERRLLRAIINPAMIAVFVFGTLLAFTPGIVDWTHFWVWGKLVGITGLTIMHHYFARWRKAFDADERRHPAKTYRIANEIPTLCMILIVFMVVLKP
ncbi:MAG: protoporphyrinogen oxidase HemJ [Alphaproteobacteria bacterium]|nr:protoporphyrinogen oxidase HemJ [Alphaproteobacteria bacterium]